ncbi:hypothetical protein Cgig2_012336 [Carnegiea gigantea]|uniref:Uncharacterized protein n=1 Tax=Carnegiea gigantea TaxID=171969 RepID=A0A9Q1Q4T1_9CARY|nr:hypothetical protein Cgig2_012336 [Carnegiea gigantea]
MDSPKGFLTGLPSFQSGTFSQPDSRRTKRKSYFQCFTFDFFSMVVMNPGLLHNLRGRRFILVQNLFNHRVKRKSETIIESHAINSYTFGRRLIHGGIRLGDYEGGIASRGSSSLAQEQPWGRESDCPDCPAGPSELGPLGILVPSQQSLELVLQELVDAPSEDEHLDELSEEEEEVSPEVELVLVEATSAAGFDELEAQQGLRCVPSANNSSGDLMRGLDLVFAIIHTWKLVIWSAMVISYGYETSTSGLRMLGVEKYSQLDHKGLSGSKRGTAY